jgi:hypothetical protein
MPFVYAERSGNARLAVTTFRAMSLLFLAQVKFRPTPGNAGFSTSELRVFADSSGSYSGQIDDDFHLIPSNRDDSQVGEGFVDVRPSRQLARPATVPTPTWVEEAVFPAGAENGGKPAQFISLNN